MSLTKTTFERLGLEGHPSAFRHSTKFGTASLSRPYLSPSASTVLLQRIPGCRNAHSSMCAYEYVVVNVELLAPAFRPGSKAYVRVRECLQRALPAAVVFTVLWVPNGMNPPDHSNVTDLILIAMHSPTHKMVFVHVPPQGR